MRSCSDKRDTKSSKNLASLIRLHSTTSCSKTLKTTKTLSTPINTNIKGRCDTGKHADQTINCRHELRFAQRNDEHLESDDTAKGKQNY